MTVIVQHYYLAACDRCGWESPDQFMTESSAEKAWIAHHNATHGSADSSSGGVR